MLPDIQSQNGCSVIQGGIHQWIVLVWRGSDFKVPFFIDDQPSPSRTETCRCRIGKGRFELFQGTKSLLDGRRKFPLGQVRSVRGQNSPEQTVVVVSPSIVSDSRREFGNFTEQIFKIGIFQLGLFKCSVQFIYISLVMLGMVYLHSCSIDIRCKGIIAIR